MAAPLNRAMAAPLKDMAVPIKKVTPVSSMDALADSVYKAVAKYVDAECNRRFAKLIEYLPSGEAYEQRAADTVTKAVQKMLERHQEQIRDDVIEIRAALSRLDALEQRLKMLEERK